jgi:surfeit locus 1 family protein
MSDARGGAPAPSFPRRIVGGVFCLVGVVILLGLGGWQLQRLKWKEDLLAHIAALKTAPAQPLPTALASADPDFTRVAFDCADILSRPRVRVYGVQNGQIVYRQMTACPVQAGGAASILVDLGFEDCAWEKPVPADEALVGVLRRPDAKTFVTPPNQPAANLWYWRDLPAMARTLNAGSPAPVFVALERGPQPIGKCHLDRNPVPIDIPNRHLEYAITWFGLAAALVGVYVATLLRRRRT